MALCSCTPGLLRLVHGFLLLAFFFRLPAAVLSEDGSCNQLNFVVTAKREVHIARQKETAGEGWYASEVPSARSFLQSPNLQACVRDIAGKLRTKSANCTAEAQGGSDACLSAEASQGLDRRSMGVLEWLHELLSLPFMRSLLRGQELKPFGSISSAYASLKESKAVKFEHSDEDVTRATERLQQLLFDEEYGSMRPKPRRTSEGVPVMEPSLKHMTRDTLQIPRMGAVVVGGQHNELQLEVIAAPAQQRPVFQISRAEDAILRVGPTGEMQVRGSLTVLNTQDAVSTGNSALVSAGGLSVAKNAVVGGRLQVEETQDASPSGAGALQVAGGLAVGKRAFFGGTVTIGRKNGDSGPRLLKVESMDDEAAVVVQSGTWEKPPLIELWASGGESRPLVASLSNQNGSLVMGAGSSGFRMQGGPLLVADESDAALKENGRVGASVLTKGGLGVAKGLHVGSDISIGKGPSQRTYPGRSLRIASPTGPSEVLLQPGAKAASRVQFGRAAVIEGINNAIEIIAGPADNLADGSPQGNWRSKGSIQLTAGANEGVQITHGKIRSGGGTTLQLEGSEGAQLSSSFGEVLVAAKGTNGVVRLRAGEGPGLTLRNSGQLGGVDLNSQRGMTVSAAEGVVTVVARGEDEGKLILRSNGPSRDSVSILAPSGGVEIVSGQQGLSIQTEADFTVHLKEKASIQILASEDSLGSNNEALESCTNTVFSVGKSGKVSVAGGSVAGTVRLVQGMVFVSTTAVTRDSVILLTPVSLRYPAPYHVVSSKTEGVGFEITAQDSQGNVAESDGSVLNWFMVDISPPCTPDA